MVIRLIKNTCQSLPVALTIFIIGCDRQTIYNNEITNAENISIKQPYEVLTILNGREKQLCGNEADSALYELVYSEALHAHEVKTYNDSALNKCAIFFQRNNDKYRQARALMMAALCMYNKGEYIGATKKLKEAETLAAGMGHGYFDNRLYETLGTLNGTAGCNEIMMFYYNKALVAAKSIDSRERTVKILNMMTKEYLRMGCKDSAMACIERCRTMKESLNEMDKADLTTNLGCYLMVCTDTTGAKKCFIEAFMCCPDRKASLILGDIYKHEGNYKMAENMWYDAVNSNSKTIRKTALKRLIETSADKKTAFFLSDLLNRTYESEMTATMARAIADIQNDYDKATNEKKQKSTILWMSVGIALMGFGITAVVFWHKRRMKKYGDIINSQNKSLDELNDRYTNDIEKYKKVENDMESIRLINCQYEQELGKKVAEMDEIQKKLSKYQCDQQQPCQWYTTDSLMNDECVYRLHRKAATGKAAAKDDWDALHKLINIHDRKLTELFDNNKGLSLNDVNIIMLTRLRFFPTEIAALTDLSSQSVTNTRARLLKKVFGVKGGAKDFDERIRNL